MPSLTTRLKEQAHALGFELVGITPAQPARGLDRFLNWLEQGYAGEMKYMERSAPARSSPDSVLPGTKSIVMLGISYHQPELRATPTPPLHGRVASYALGEDYHQVIWGKLNQLSAWLSTEVAGSESRGVTDTAPLLERDYARLAGLGWFGKNTMLIHKQMGSFLFLSALLTDVELEVDVPHVASHCGTCTACLDACPTKAFPEPGVLDATKCISYLTIELKGTVPLDLRAGTGNWLFGCDICQDVCPWNRKAPRGREPALLAEDRTGTMDLVEILSMPLDAFRRRFKTTALWRTKRQGLLRNACIVLANQRNRQAIPALQQAAIDSDEVISEAARWALTQLQKSDSNAAEPYHGTASSPGLKK